MKVKYIVKPEEKMIIGITKVDRHDLFSRVRDNLEYHFLFTLMCRVPEKIVFKAIARCADGDEFNEETGKKLVDAKLAKKMHDYVIDRLNKAYNNAEKFRNHMLEIAKYHYGKSKNIERDLVEYFGVEVKNE